jgi:Na+/melibiose symporter-like transporter
MKERSVFTVMQLLLKKFDASDMIAGLLMGSLPQAIAMVLSPIIAYKSDRHRGPWGRRIPFLLIPTPIASLAMVGLAFSPLFGQRLHLALGMHSLGLNPSILIFLGLFWTLFEFGTITANAVFGGLVNDVVPRAVIGRFYGMFRALSLIAGMIFNFWLIGKAETGYRWIFSGIALLYGAGFAVMCLKVKEGDYPPPPPKEPGNAGGFLKATKAYFQDCFSHSYYLWFFALMALSMMSFVPVNLFSVFFAKSLRMDVTTYGRYIVLTHFISLCLSYFLG